ncbi:hypothetical protein [Lactobacillus bombicola]|uniref:Uncharacterized protein n=1 Tax=Lactobacillus bombicola TaxID=1505723 RepID=A0ABX9LWL2_9LACO|nr:hypothetical protein [Lactobacillus bombicola]RHW49008.1 hypothetical protein DS833_05760 [Lactobacillus bombicola]RHW53547.1 hypothetical protein DS834_01005 [Lactobacillus bombicola]
MGKISEAKKRANKKWDEKNKNRKKYLVYRSQAKSFIRRFATQEDLDELEKLIAEKRKNL